MALEDFGLSFEEAEKEAQFKTAPSGTYNFRVASYQPKTNDKGRRRYNFRLEIFNAPNPELNGVGVFYNCPLMWNNPETGQIDKSGIGFSTDLVKGVGGQWQGTGYDPDTLIGLEGTFQLTLEEYQGKPVNRVVKILPKA